MSKIKKISFVGHLHIEDDNKSFDSPEFTIPIAKNEYEVQQLFNALGNLVGFVSLIALIGAGLNAISKR